jgi:chorismate mutase
MSQGRSLQGVRDALGKALPGSLGKRGPVSRAAARGAFPSPNEDANLVDLKRRRDQLSARVAELQFDLGGLVYEMAIRDSIRVEVLVRRAAVLQDADAELSEVERILRLEQSSTAGECASCGAPHSSGAAFCWQCGQPLLAQVHTDAIGGSPPTPPTTPTPLTSPVAAEPAVDRPLDGPLRN